MYMTSYMVDHKSLAEMSPQGLPHNILYGRQYHKTNIQLYYTICKYANNIREMNE
jgi:hypothetical protein